MQHNTAVLSTHPVSPHTGWANTSLSHRKFRKFKIEHQHFQSQEVPVSPPHQQGMGPGEGKAEAARDSGSPSADEPRHTATAGNRNSHPLGTFQLHQGIQDRTYTRWGVTSNWRRCLLPRSAPRGVTNDSSFGAGRHWEKEGCGAEPLPSPSPPGPDSPVPLVPLS